MNDLNFEHVAVGIDPGTEKSAWILGGWNAGDQAICPIKWGEQTPNEDLRDKLANICDSYNFNNQGAHSFAVVCEGVKSYGKPVGATTFTTVEWIGRYNELCYERQIPYFKYFEPVWRLWLCKNPRASESTAGQAVRDRYIQLREDSIPPYKNLLPKKFLDSAPAGCVTDGVWVGGGATPAMGTKGKPGPLYAVKAQEGTFNHLRSAFGVLLYYKEKILEQREW